MRLGIVAYVPRDIDEITPEVARRVREHGFRSIFFSLQNDPADISDQKARSVRELLGADGVDVGQYWGRYVALVRPDSDHWPETMRLLGETMRVAARLGCRCVIVPPGSLNPAGPYAPHRLNNSDQALERLIERCQEAVKPAEQYGVYLALEPHTLCILNTPERAKLVIDAVGSPALAIEWDPVNWLSFETLYTSGEVIQRTYDVLGERLVTGHAKDITPVNRLVVHLDETYAGNGELDYATFLACFSRLEPWKTLYIEHTPEEHIPSAKRHIETVAQSIGVSVTE